MAMSPCHLRSSSEFTQSMCSEVGMNQSLNHGVDEGMAMQVALHLGAASSRSPTNDAFQLRAARL